MAAAAAMAANGSRREGVRARERGGAATAVDVAEIQRARILAAMFEVACKRGAAGATVAHVVARSGVSRRTFYENFTDREECLLAALQSAVSHATERVLPAYRGETRWLDRIRAALFALLSFFDEEPVVGRVLVVESLSAGPNAIAWRGRLLAQITEAVDDGRSEVRSGAEPPPLTAEGVVGGALAIVHARLVEADHAPLVGLVGPLMSMIALPYLGAAAARREFARPVPVAAPTAHEAVLLSDPFKAAGMRLTYRTVRVLMAIAQLGERGSDPSNRAVGDMAGVKDQGQVSKLLSRLERIGLIVNTGHGGSQGAPNAWSLTDKGRQIEHGIRAHGEVSD